MEEYVDIHTHHVNIEWEQLAIHNYVLPLNEIPSAQYFSAGWHPWHLNGFSADECKSEFKRLASYKNFVAVGECGLDRKKGNNWDEQILAFETQLEIAKEYKKPLILHAVKSYSDLLQLLKMHQFENKVLIHGFIGNEQVIMQFSTFDTYFSFGKSIFNDHSKSIELLKTIAPEKIFFETDDSNFSISDIYLRAATIRQVSVEELSRITKNNFRKFIGDELVR
ncbi:MAG TPA: TatD family hydrolase [Prolixibacteraceae bacterium]|nr:TatD family hydrolase [Prolixibacteraceae bacterium]HQN92991.1 TatD family hydrolase [Prolixibacteraceae bacterium]HUM88433.1 TatD family hydrolase [Prolixibacteraceae bacterium]